MDPKEVVMSKVSPQNIIFVILVILLSVIVPLAAVDRAEAAGTMKDYCITPPFVSDTAPPLVMVIMSKDHKQFYKAYNDIIDLDEDGSVDNTYKDTIGWEVSTGKGGYYGYFDPNKCYTYNTGTDQFVASSLASGAHNHYCTGASEWSGNFLNWGTMTRMDIMRKVLYGGKRVIDTGGNTALGRSVLPRDAHSFAKVYKGADLNSLVPTAFETADGITLCNTNTADNGAQATGSLIFAIRGYFPYADATETYQCQKTSNTGVALVNVAIGTNPAINQYWQLFATIKVCDNTLGTAYLEPNCLVYFQGASAPEYKPTGLMQKYGVNRHESDDTSDDTASMLFGLITGSFSENTNDKGGVLRANFKSVTDEFGNANGQLQNSSEIVKNIDLFKIVDYTYSSGYSTQASWENPVGEMVYEGLRYFMGKQTPTTTFKTATADQRLNNATIEAQWDNPFAANPRCSKPYFLIMSDLSPSFDSDHLPGSYWVSAPSPNDTGLNVQTLMNASNANINTIESIGQIFIGENAGTYDTECTAKPVAGIADFASIRGLCIDEPTRQGSYYIAGLAWWAHTHDVNAATGDQKVTTYVVATSAPVPELSLQIGGVPIKILPIHDDATDNSKGQIVNFKVLVGDGVTCIAGDTDCAAQVAAGYSHGYEIMWDDCEAGCDHDLDAVYRIYGREVGGQLELKTKGVYSNAGNTNRVGYIITGVVNPGQYYELSCGGNSGGTDCDRYCNGAFTNILGVNYCNGTDTTKRYTYNTDNANVRICTNAKWVNCTADAACNAVIPGDTCAAASSQFMEDSEIVRRFTPAASTAKILKSPLWYAAKYGGFSDTNGSLTPDLTSEWDKDLDGNPDTYFYAANPLRLEAELDKALTDILRRSASGTAASVLASGEGSGANLVQAIFYPKRAFFDETEILWTGTLENLWYYIDPRSSNSSIRENTADAGGVKDLKLDSDRIVKFFFDSGTQKTRARLFNSNSDGTTVDTNSDSVINDLDAVSTVNIEDLNYLWEAGRKLWERNLTTSPRSIYTNLNTGVALTNAANAFSTTAAQLAALRPYLNTDDKNGDTAVTGNRTATQNDAVAQNLIDYVHGKQPVTNQGTSTDLTKYTDTKGTISYRNRKVKIDLNNDGLIAASEYNVWKLGDVVNSTPRIVSWTALNQYDRSYGDATYTSFLGTSTYKTRGMVFAGANDGMLHAFTLGTLDVINDSSSTKAKLCEDSSGDRVCDAAETGTSNMGQEAWAFIPKNSLPYLKYMYENNYCHIYYNDLTPVIFDASFDIDSDTNDDGTADQPVECTSSEYWRCIKGKDSWRTVLIGGMRLGGGCQNACPNTSTDPNCVQTPATDKGYSSYFALDITNPAVPTLLWEFSNLDIPVADRGLGLSTTGPAIVKINARIPNPDGTSTSVADKSRNGRWFAVFGSGPTGFIDTTTHQFNGHSTQNAKLFVLDLKTGTLVRTIDSGIANAFVGSMKNATIDYDFDYQDDAMYMGYTTTSTTSPNVKTDPWTGGGVLRLITREDLNGTNLTSAGTTALNPANWQLTRIIHNNAGGTHTLGPVTAAVGHLAHYATNATKPDEAYIYFGNGRYFFKSSSAVAADNDDATNQRAIFGVKEQCLSKILNITTTASPTCVDAAYPDTVSKSDLGNATGVSAGAVDVDGWYINLDPQIVANSTFAERVITDPLATPTGAIFFTSFAPSSDICAYGGSSFIWAVKYDTGGTVASSLRGVGLLQVSTGEIREVELSSQFTQKEGRRTAAFDGVPPTDQGLALVVPPKAINKVLHIRKK